MVGTSFTFSFRRGLHYGAAGAVVLLATGCLLRPAPFSPLPPLAPPPDRLGQILPTLEKRWPPVPTLQSQGELVLSGEGIRGKTWLQGTVLYAAPDRLRFRASRLPLGTVFEILQMEGDVRIKLNRERKVFQGTAGELAARPEFIGAIEPLELVRSLLVGENLLEAIRGETAQGRDPAGLVFRGDRLTVSRVRAAPGDRSRERLEEFVVRRTDGLIEEARVSERAGPEWRRRVTVVYRNWQEIDGRVCPREFDILAEQPATRLRVTVDKVQFNPSLSPRVFLMDTEGDTIHPLAELFAPAPQEGS